MDKMDKSLIHGVGVYTKGNYSSRIDGKITKEYHTWWDMLRRCYNKEYQIKYPTYVGCCVSEKFLNFQHFAEWCHSQIGFTNKGWHLDKDVLVEGNREYSEDTCCFIPNELNALLNKNSSRRGKYKIGVSYDKHKGKFQALISKYGVTHNIGRFYTEDEAHLAYTKEKALHIVDVVERYKGSIDSRVSKALLSKSF